MKTKLLIIVLFALAFVIRINPQTQKPKQATAKPTQTVQKQTTSNVEVTIMHDNERQFYYIAEKSSKKFIKILLYKEVNQFCEGMALIKTDKGVGFINEKGVEIVPPDGKYQWAKDFSNGLAVVGTNDENDEKKTAGFINKSGVLTIPMIYQDARNFSENLAAVKKNGKWGYINKTGTAIIPLKYTEAFSFVNGLAIAEMEITQKNGNKIRRYGYIDKTGKTIIPFKYTEATEFRKSYPNEYAIVEDENYYYHLIDKTGKSVNDLKYYLEKKVYNSILKYDEDKSEYISPISAEWSGDGDDLITLEYKKDYYQKLKGVYSIGAATFKVKPEYADLLKLNNGDYLVLSKYNLKGICDYTEIVPAVFDFIYDQDSLYYAIDGGKETKDGIEGGKFVLYDYAGNKLTKYDTKESYDDITPFFEGMARVKRNGKFGFINKKGEEIIPLEYDETGIFSSGLVAVMKEKKAGAINKKNEPVIPLEYESLGSIMEGVTWYKKDSLFGIIDVTGKKITEPVFEGIGNFSEGLAPFIKDKKVGYLNTKGEIIIPVKFDLVNSFSEEYALISQDKKVGFIDQKGDVVIPCKYDDGADFKDGYALVIEGKKYFLIDKKGNVVKSY